jgi:hypothetical protein
MVFGKNIEGSFITVYLFTVSGDLEKLSDGRTKFTEEGGII